VFGRINEEPEVQGGTGHDRRFPRTVGPADLHYGRAWAVRAQCAAVLNEAYATHPERFVRQPPTPPALPEVAWINKPEEGPLAQYFVEEGLIELDTRRVAGGTLTDPMTAIVADDALKALGAESAGPEHLDDGQGSRLDLLVVLGCHYTNTPLAINGQFTAVLDGGPIALMAANTLSFERVTAIARHEDRSRRDRADVRRCCG
jgi:hypothetical protein